MQRPPQSHLNEFFVDSDGNILDTPTRDAFRLNREDVTKFAQGVEGNQASLLGRAFNHATPPESAMAVIPPLVETLFAGTPKDQRLFDFDAFMEWSSDDRANESPFTVAGEFQPGLVSAAALPADKQKRDVYLKYIKSLFQQARTLIVDEKNR